MENIFVFGFYLIFGKFGKGKTTLNAILGLLEMHNPFYYENSLLEIADLEQHFGRTFNRPTQPHTVYANFNLTDGKLKNYDYDFDDFMLPNGDFDFELLVPYACFHGEESQSGRLLSYDWNSMPKPALLAYARPRHAFYTFILDVQLLENMNKSVRQFTYEYLSPLDIVIEKNKLNKISRVTVVTGVFRNYNKALEFELTQDLDLVDEIRDYVYNGNIWNCFSSNNKKYEFFDVPSNKDFIFERVKINKIKENKGVEEIIVW